LPPEQFWDVSPREASAIIKGAAGRLRREHNNRAWLAWHIAGLDRTKKLPKLESMLVKDGAAKAPQSWEHQLMIARMWHSRLQGKKPDG